MTIELMRERPSVRIDPDLQATVLFSLLGLLLSVALLSVLGSIPASVLMLAG